MKPLRCEAGCQTYVQILLAHLKECSKTQDLERGKRVHAEARECGHDSSVYIASALINLYARCGSTVEARHVFDKMKHPNVVSWNAIILGYAENGQDLTALELLKRMKLEGPVPNSVTFLASLKACSALTLREGGSDRGKSLHNLVVENGLSASDIYLQNALIDMYAKCGCMVSARQVLHSMRYADVVSWTALIMGYAETREGLVALALFTRMRNEGHEPDPLTFVAAFKACISLVLNSEGREGTSECRDRGRETHNLAVEHGWDSDIYVQSTLIDMYSRCCSMSDARQVFDSMTDPDLVSWNVLLLGYSTNGQALTALELFKEMRSKGPVPHSVTFLAVLKACTFLGEDGECRDRCKQIHNLAVECSTDSDMYVQNTLINVYAKCGSIADARPVFESMSRPLEVSWNVLILGYAENGQSLVALELFTRMRNEGLAPSSVTFSAALKTATLLGALELGRAIHAEMDPEKLDLILVNCLVDFYAKCGSLVEARRVFDQHSETRDLNTWTALLAGYSSCGDDESVFELFDGLQNAGLRPDSITFLCVLNCCSHGGLVEKGRESFDEMSSKYGVVPAVEHYTCMVDILGRASKLDDAMALLQCMPCSPDGVTWMTVLGACRQWKNVELGRLAFQCWICYNDRDAAGYVVMGQMYASKGMLQEQEIVMRMRMERKPRT